MNGSGQRTIPNVVFPFRSMISKSFSITGRLNDDGSRTVTVDVSFGGVHYRFDPETQLEYLRPNQNEQNL